LPLEDIKSYSKKVCFKVAPDHHHHIKTYSALITINSPSAHYNSQYKTNQHIQYRNMNRLAETDAEKMCL